MMLKFLFLISSIFLYIGPALSECLNPGNKLVVLLKLDDVTEDVDASKNAFFARRWSRVTEFLESNGLAASYGVIGNSLETNNDTYFEWLRARQRKGVIELWNHGYTIHFSPNSAAGEIGEFNGTSAEVQGRSIARTQELARKKAGIIFKGFGPHNSAVDRNTFNQLDDIHEINFVWFYKPLDGNFHNQIIILRDVELETPIFHPYFEAFLNMFAKRNRSLNYIAMQGHPWSWDDNAFNSFVRVVKWLQSRDAVFCKPSDYLKSVSLVG